MADSFKLPGSSYEEVTKIIKAYAMGKEGQPQTLDAIAQSTGMDKTIVSRNNGFLVQLELLTEGNKKTPTTDCFTLGRAYSLGMTEEIQKNWRMLIERNEFLTRMISAIRIRNGMDRTALSNHILYSAGSTTSAAKVGANTLIEIFKASGIVTEEDGKITAVDINNFADDELSTKSFAKDIRDTDNNNKGFMKTVVNGQSVINININIAASVGELDELSEKIKFLLNSIQE